jgi:cytochrome b561
MKLKVLDQFFHNHFKTILLSVKIVLIPITIIYFLLAMVLAIIEKKHKENENVKKWKKGISIFNNILFYIIIVFIILTSGVLLFVMRSSSFYIFQKSLNNFRKNKKILKSTITIPHEFLSYYLSVIWWMIFYLIVVTIFVSVAKIKHDPQLIYNMF